MSYRGIHVLYQPAQLYYSTKPQNLPKAN
ncbi:hypothetical protein EDD25_3382 [Cryobacterium psychrophilum]|nr:hypothetical protein EDD25_3382 [Cryobacterium psychrophilum]